MCWAEVHQRSTRIFAIANTHRCAPIRGSGNYNFLSTTLANINKASDGYAWFQSVLYRLGVCADLQTIISEIVQRRVEPQMCIIKRRSK